MRAVKIKTNRFKRYSQKVDNFKVDKLADYKGTGENVRGYIKYDPSVIADNSPDEGTLPIKTGYKSKSIKEGV